MGFVPGSMLNHTAEEQEWAQHAIADDAEDLHYYHTFDDRALPDAYEQSLPKIFPGEAPGGFTFGPDMAGSGCWVWTTFYDYQWDLNYIDPAVFTEMLAIWSTSGAAARPARLPSPRRPCTWPLVCCSAAPSRPKPTAASS
jgi:glycosidase